MGINSINSNNTIINSYGKNKVRDNTIEVKSLKINDKLEISKEAKIMQERELDIKVSYNKDIERIKRAIKDGSYIVNSENLARAMIDKMRGNDI